MSDASGPIDRPGQDRPIKRRCTAHRGDGEQCRRSAVRGTNVCPSHGGSARQVRLAAARREAEAEAAGTLERWTPPPDGQVVDVLGELVELVATSTSFYRFATAQLAALSAEDWAARDTRVELQVRQFQAAAAQTGKLLTDLTKIGLAAVDREAVARSHGVHIASAMNRVFDRVGFNYRPDRIQAILVEELRRTGPDERR